MSKKNNTGFRVQQSLFTVRGYIGFFVLIALVVTCSFLLFYGLMNHYANNMVISAILTLFNVLFLSALICVIDGIRRKITIVRPVNRILEATHKLTSGDFSARIKPLHRYGHENEFDAIIENFNKMAHELSGIETLRTDFIANVSHEIKTPLSIIHSYATALQDGALADETRKEYSETIISASRRLTNLISNILKLSKLENQEIFPESKRYALGEQLRCCILGFEDVWEQKGLELIADIDDMSVNCDESLLELVWNNLLSNAIKFTEAGGTVTVRLKKENGTAIATFSDTGCGMTQAVGAHIFEKFYQGDSSHAAEGSGLGLALVKRVIDIVGGTISVDSTVGKGSTFTVTLNNCQ